MISLVSYPPSPLSGPVFNEHFVSASIAFYCSHSYAMPRAEPSEPQHASSATSRAYASSAPSTFSALMFESLVSPFLQRGMITLAFSWIFSAWVLSWKKIFAFGRVVNIGFFMLFLTSPLDAGLHLAHCCGNGLCSPNTCGLRTRLEVSYS